MPRLFCVKIVADAGTAFELRLAAPVRSKRVPRSATLGIGTILREFELAVRLHSEIVADAGTAFELRLAVFPVRSKRVPRSATLAIGTILREFELAVRLHSEIVADAGTAFELRLAVPRSVETGSPFRYTWDRHYFA